MKHSLAITLYLFVCLSSLAAQSPQRGLVTSANCPYTCKDAGIPSQFCRERQNGDLCEVEDLSQAPGHRTLARIAGAAPETTALKTSGSGPVRTWRDTNGTWVTIPSSALAGTAPKTTNSNSGTRGLITTANCPYNCKMAKLPADQCRESQSGGICSVEDLTQAPGHRTLMRLPAN